MSTSMMTTSSLYGDLISSLTMCVVFPAYVRQVVSMDQDDSKRTAAIIISCNSCNILILYTLATFRDSLLCSRLAFGFCVLGTALINLVEWPNAGECIITPMLVGSIFIGVLGNISLSFNEKNVRLLMLFLVGSYVSIMSPHSTYTEDALPILGGAILLAMMFLASISKIYQIGGILLRRMDLVAVHGARLVLAVIFFYHASKVLFFSIASQSSKSAYEQVIDLLKGAIIAVVGVAATGSFTNEINHKEQLEVLVKKRTKQIQEQADKLHMVNMALQASETAVAITDSDQQVVWLNVTFEQLCFSCQKKEKEKGEEVALIGQPLDCVLALDSNDDNSNDGNVNKTNTRRKINDAFDLFMTKEEEINLGGSIFNLDVVPFPDNDSHIDNKNATKKENHLTYNCNDNVVSSTASCNNRKSSRPSFTKTDTDKNSRRYLVAFKDITTKRAKERAEEAAQQEATMAKAMQDSMVTLTHELRTPLQGIMGIASMLLQEEQDDNSTSNDNNLCESMKLIMASSSLQLNLINNLLDIKKASAHMMDEFHLSSIAAVRAIKDAIDFCRPMASISSVSIAVDYEDSKHAIVKSNALRLQQVLINLISNSIKYTSEGSKIRITIRPNTVGGVERMMDAALASTREKSPSSNADYSESEKNNSNLQRSIPAAPSRNDNDPVFVFCVSDSGPGIALDQSDRLFQRFSRLDSQPSRTLGNSSIGQPSGTGLGLHLCQIFVRRMNGHIWATNNNDGTGKGSTFSFDLPLVSNNNAEQYQQLFLQSGSRGKTSSIAQLQNSFPNDNNGIMCRSYRVLVVDDTLINRKVFERMLKNINAISFVTTVDSGHNAMAELKLNQYDIVITDIQMPGMSGTELSRAIFEKRIKCSPPPVVVGLTADTSPDVIVCCKASGMSDVIYKPITVAEMIDYFKTTIGTLRPGVWYTDWK